MFNISIETNEVKTYLSEIRGRAADISAFHRHVTRPFLLRQFGIAYHAAGIGVVSGRLHASLIDLKHPEHYSRITASSITEGTLVPYAGIIESRKPFLSRIVRSNTLAQFLVPRLEEYILNG